MEDGIKLCLSLIKTMRLSNQMSPPLVYNILCQRVIQKREQDTTSTFETFLLFLWEI